MRRCGHGPSGWRASAWPTRNGRRNNSDESRPNWLDSIPPTDSEPDLELNAALARLSELDQEILRLWAWEELAPREIAVILSMTPNAISLRLYRAKASLAALLGQKTASSGHGVVEGSP